MRRLWKAPGATAIAVSTLALGIGASAGIFTVVNAQLLRPLPYSDPGRLVEISAPAKDQMHAGGWLSYPHLQFERGRNRSFAAIAACTFEIFNLTGHGDPEQVPSGRVTAEFFPMLGVKPIAGRTFLPEEDRPGGAPVVMLGYELAQRLFGAAGDAVGDSVTLDSRSYTIVGVLPPRFNFPLVGAKADIWAPRVFDLSLVTPARVEAGGTYFHVVGRLRPEVSREKAQTELQAIYQQYRQENPGKYDASIDVAVLLRDLHERFVANVRPTLLFLACAVGLLLLIACSNAASLQLARMLGQRKEFAVRTALGAPRRAIVLQVLGESMALALAGAAVGVVLGAAGSYYLSRADQSSIPPIQAMDLDLRFFAFAFAITLFSGLLVGLAPAFQLSSPEVNAILRDEGRGNSGGRRRTRARSFLVIAQVALSTVLLVASALLARSFWRLTSVSPGFEPDHLLTLEMTLPGSKYSKRAQLTEFYDSVLRQVRALPGVEAAALSTAVPASATHQTPALFEGQPAVPLGKRPIINLQQLSIDYAKTLRVPLLAGRVFTAHDDAQSPPVAMVNQSALRRFWPGGAVGKRVWVGGLPNPYEVVGVLADVKNDGLASPPEPEVFLPLAQFPWTLLYLSARTAGDPHSLIPPIRHAIAAVDREQPLTRVMTGEELVASANAEPRFTLSLIAVFSVTAFLIAAVGIYGVIAYSVAQRTQEIGIRAVLGAGQAEIFRLVIGGGLRLTAFGILLGLAGSLAATRLMSSLLYQTSTSDPVAFTASAALFTVIGALAAYVPARRAARIDPADALRAE